MPFASIREVVWGDEADELEAKLKAAIEGTGQQGTMPSTRDLLPKLFKDDKRQAQRDSEREDYLL